MKKHNIVLCSVAGACLLLFVLLLVLVRTVDVAPTGADGVRVGLSTLNGAVLDACGAKDTWDTVTDALMLLSFAVPVCFGVLGLWQLIRRKRFLAVDRELYVILAAYAVMLVVYVLFLFVTVNGAPYLENGELKSSFPSSHTLAVAVILGTGALWAWRHTAKRALRALAAGGAAVFTGLVAVGRLLAGKHWLTDVLAALLLAAALVLAVAAVPPQKKAE